ncbi:MAG: putative lipid II flippase FtsW [Eggerthellaceae bacterium]|nr:putative lipid II flippase FtsW [Eggerthellaceae bacterium]
MIGMAKNKTGRQGFLPSPKGFSRALLQLPKSIAAPRLMLLVVTIALLLLGCVMVYSTSSIAAISAGGDPKSELYKQLFFMAFGVVCCIVLWKVPYRLWMGRLVWVAWALGIALLIATMIWGTSINGAQRWIIFGASSAPGADPTDGLFSFQGSEFVKIALILMSARILIDFRNKVLSLKAMVISAIVLIFIPVMFLYRMQTDLGTTIICFIGVLAVMWFGEVPWKVILGVLLAGVVFGVVAVLSSSFRSGRLVFLDPWNDGSQGLDTGYQFIQARYAFGDGGLLGVGLGNSLQKYSWLTQSDTDFIFAIIGEELGLVGAFSVVVLFLLFLHAGLKIASRAKDNFGTILAGSLTVLIVFQAFLNMAGVLNLFMATGKPLPFVSSGGSSLVACLCMVGLILSVSQDQGKLDAYGKRRENLRVVRAVGYGDGFDEYEDAIKSQSTRRVRATRNGGMREEDWGIPEGQGARRVRATRNGGMREEDWAIPEGQGSFRARAQQSGRLHAVGHAGEPVRKGAGTRSQKAVAKDSPRTRRKG